MGWAINNVLTQTSECIAERTARSDSRAPVALVSCPRHVSTCVASLAAVAPSSATATLASCGVVGDCESRRGETDGRRDGDVGMERAGKHVLETLPHPTFHRSYIAKGRYICFNVETCEMPGGFRLKLEV